METERTGTQVFESTIADLTSRLLVAIGEDPVRDGLSGTPARVAGWWNEFIHYEPGNTDVTFEAITTDQMVVVSGIQFYTYLLHGQ